MPTLLYLALWCQAKSLQTTFSRYLCNPKGGTSRRLESRRKGEGTLILFPGPVSILSAEGDTGAADASSSCIFWFAKQQLQGLLLRSLSQLCRTSSEYWNMALKRPQFRCFECHWEARITPEKSSIRRALPSQRSEHQSFKELTQESKIR